MIKNIRIIVSLT